MAESHDPPADGVMAESHDPPADTVTPASDHPPTDSVAALLKDWARADPGLDVSAAGIVVRMGRIRAQLEAMQADAYRAHGITAADFAALSILRRNSPVPMSGLADGLYLSAGTVTPRARRLAAAGLVRITPNPADARVRMVELTPHGRQVFDAVAPAHLAAQRDVLRALTAEQSATLADLLARVLADLENR